MSEVAKRGRRNEVVGEVMSDKMDKTISVKIFRTVKHPKYGKYIKKTSLFKAHDEKNEAKTGDMVIAPAYFTHTHRGCVPKSNDKYILTSWVLFNRAEQIYGQPPRR